MDYQDFEIKSVKIGDKNYPKRLSEIKNYPKKIFYRGNIGILTSKILGVVGSRRMTRYGKIVIKNFIPALVSEGVVTVSGFMYGVDTEVARETLLAGGKTVAVFGCGLDVVYPPENKKLYTQILENDGLVLSEYEKNAKPHLWKFPQRNRIVAGVTSLGVLIIEAGINSGSLITARLARSMGKKIWAVPGPIDSLTSQGTNYFIKKGFAKMATEPCDILSMKRIAKRVYEKSNLDSFEKRIFNILAREPLGADEISQALSEDISRVSSALTVMTIKGIISESGGKFYNS